MATQQLKTSASYMVNPTEQVEISVEPQNQFRDVKQKKQKNIFRQLAVIKNFHKSIF